MADGDLHDALRAAVRSTRAASSAYRPAVAEYLYRRGLAPLFDRLAADGPPPRRLIEGIWRLMLETVATRRFGVSTDDWRSGGYPDRYFPLIWLELVPRRLPQMAPAARAGAVTALFNLGEKLPRAAANPVAERLVERGAAFAVDPEGILRSTLRAAGVLGAAAVAGWRRLVEQPAFECRDVDPDFLPGAVLAAPARRFVVVDALRPVALHIGVGPDGLGCRSTGAAPPSIEPIRSVELDRVRLTLEGRTIAWRGRDGRGAHPLDGVAPAALAANAEGDVLWIDAASTRVRWLRADG